MRGAEMDLRFRERIFHLVGEDAGRETRDDLLRVVLVGAVSNFRRIDVPICRNAHSFTNLNFSHSLRDPFLLQHAPPPIPIILSNPIILVTQ